MSELHESFWTTLAIAPPLVATLFLGLWGLRLRNKGWAEAFIHQLVSWSFGLSFIACVVLGVELWLSGRARLFTDFEPWFKVGHYEFHLSLVADRLSVPMAAFSSALLFVVGAFSRKYLHRERGFLRFFFLLALFGSGVLQMLFAGSLDFAFFGWELVGLSSALLIGFFHERPGPVRHALRAFVIYRICDIGLLSAAVLLHHQLGHTMADNHVSGVSWGSWAVPESESARLLIGFCILWASMGKAAQFPLGGWLPRAMEGPTPSSAIFYGAISVHLGPYLLLRAAPLISETPVLAWGVIAVGGFSALYSTLVGRVQTDIKSALAYSVMTQVGIIYVEIGLGFYHLALLHVVGHATLRCLQILRSPSILSDKFALERARGEKLPQLFVRFEKALPLGLQRKLYRFAIERAYLDAFGRVLLLKGLALLRALDSLERQWVNLLLGSRKRADPTHLNTPPESKL